ncbi:interferon-related developmental regulator-domain-containing protein [Macrophomina phaseolina]|uniref:Interferon-related developmental regulator-domain-containing protein n=1 Tax=Macrophomina phaseolina TaxID=35725 RepID=A0ABQ8GGL5_9PEZI|nr:interferon-related developmental regulator-domain-containing protein [Macrophomina phaseolina]
MPDLRRQVLESGKTVSRKARSRIASGASSKASSTTNSRAVSRTASRTVSRNASDEEEGNLSDGTTWSTNSIDDILAAEDLDAPPDVWKAQLADRVAEIIDRKRSSNQGRSDALAAYSYLLKAHYACEDIEHKVGELIPAIIKSIKSETSERETIMALKAIEMTVITTPSDLIYDAIVGPVKRIINDSKSLLSKVAAIHTLGTATFYGGASLDETQDVMDYFVEIVESDGLSIDAGDEASVVVAALEEWGFLATQLDDLEDVTEAAMEAFVEQLDSADLTVQIAAGENIALLYEKSCTEIEDDEEPSSDEEVEDPDATPGAPKMIKRYTVYRREDQLLHKLEALATLNGAEIGRVAKKDRSRMRSSFADILNSVEHPTRGPRYSTAWDPEKERAYGSRMTIKINRTGEMRIDKWWKLFRLSALRRALQGGFVTHYENNEVVFDSLPTMITRKAW